jgi:hypothetical protein
VLTLKYDDDFRRLGFVGRQTGQLRIAPVGKVYHRPRRRVDTLVRLYDSRKNVWSPNNSLMVIGDHLGFELVRVCSTCAEFSFITDSIRLLCRASA